MTATDGERSLIVLSTAGSQDQAESIARGLLERRLAACVNVVPQICSIYRWKGEVVEEGESLLIIKTAEHLLPEVEAAIGELHSYEVPEMLALPVVAGSESYLSWLAESLRRDA